MKHANIVRRAACVLAGILAGAPLASIAQVTTLPSEMPESFKTFQQSFDYERRIAEIPMRDGVHLHTVILVPKGARSRPILLTRTPYKADDLTNIHPSGNLASILQGYDNPADVIAEDGYIRVIQDVRGKYKSEGDYVMNRPMRGPQNPTPVDHSTDTYDTIDWLVKNIPETNGKVGILGISYDGFLSLTPLVNPHPALKVAVPMNPMVDGWRGDDWFHNGAFRQQNLAYIYEQEATRENDEKWWSSFHDDYDLYMSAGNAGEVARSHGMDQVGFYPKLSHHPAYDAFWQDQAMDRILAAQPLSVPTMLVHGLWDQEDIYGDIAVYKALKPLDVHNDKVFLVLGPWYHGQQIHDGTVLGKIRFGADAALYFRQQILRPFLAHYLMDAAPTVNIAPVTAYETGTNHWLRLNGWPEGCTASCEPALTPLYLQASQRLGFEAPAHGAAAFDEYLSDPARPVPFRSRPIQPMGYSDGLTWQEWLVDDQREASGRTDVLSYVSDLLRAPLKISGQAQVNLIASTTGTDGDFVVKLIDVFPDEYPMQREMGGYQLPIAMDIFRGRYRESLEKPQALKPNAPLAYRFALPPANHVFLPGHRLMVQVQSSWFPLYDRNPQTFVDNIFFARPADYRKATIRVYHSDANASFIGLPLRPVAEN
ncbi:MAG: CocE/NonD family hydrolase [Steroidobacterales bacterium]